MAVTPAPALATAIVTGGTPVTVIPANPNGGVITNPYDATEELIVNPVGAAGSAAGGSNFALQPGQSWDVIPGQTTATSCNAATNGHFFSAIQW